MSIPVTVWSKALILRLLECFNRGLETRWSHGCSYLCLLCVGLVAASAMGLACFQRTPVRCICDVDTSKTDEKCYHHVKNIRILICRQGNVWRLLKGKDHPMTCLFRHRWGTEKYLQPTRNLGVEIGRVFSTTLQLLYPQESPSNASRCIGGWMGLEAVLSGHGKSRTARIRRSPDSPAQSESILWG
jgi:hypothetical protein